MQYIDSLIYNTVTELEKKEQAENKAKKIEHLRHKQALIKQLSEKIEKYLSKQFLDETEIFYLVKDNQAEAHITFKYVVVVIFSPAEVLEINQDTFCISSPQKVFNQKMVFTPEELERNLALVFHEINQKQKIFIVPITVNVQVICHDAATAKTIACNKCNNMGLEVAIDD